MVVASPVEPVPPNFTSLADAPTPPVQFAVSDQLVVAVTPGLPIHGATAAEARWAAKRPASRGTAVLKQGLDGRRIYIVTMNYAETMRKSISNFCSTCSQKLQRSPRQGQPQFFPHNRSQKSQIVTHSDADGILTGGNGEGSLNHRWQTRNFTNGRKGFLTTDGG